MAKTPAQEAIAWKKVADAMRGRDAAGLKKFIYNAVQYMGNTVKQRYLKKMDASGQKFAKNAPFTIAMKRGSVGKGSRVAKLKKLPTRGGASVKSAREKIYAGKAGRPVVGEGAGGGGGLRKSFMSPNFIKWFRWGVQLGGNLPRYAGWFSEGWKQKFEKDQAYWFAFRMADIGMIKGSKDKPPSFWNISKVAVGLMKKEHESPARHINQANEKDVNKMIELVAKDVISFIRRA